MTVEYVNRRGDRYFVFRGQTKSGKPKYFASKSATSNSGERVEWLPYDFEIFENPGTALVSVRRRKRSLVLPAERDLIDRLTTELSACACTQTIIDGDRIVVSTPDSDPRRTVEQLGEIFGSVPFQAAEWIQRNMTYTAEMRFTIVADAPRVFLAERYCYRGSIDGWIEIGGPAPLELLARNLVTHLGQESFYELF